MVRLQNVFQVVNQFELKEVVVKSNLFNASYLFMGKSRLELRALSNFVSLILVSLAWPGDIEYEVAQRPSIHSHEAALII